MMIAVPASSDKTSALIDDRFGRCPFFCFHDTTTGKTTFMENGHKNGAGGVGPRVVEFLGSNGINKVLAVEFGPKATDMLDKLNIEKQIIVSGQTIRQIIEMCNDQHE